MIEVSIDELPQGIVNTAFEVAFLRISNIVTSDGIARYRVDCTEGNVRKSAIFNHDKHDGALVLTAKAIQAITGGV